MRGIPEHLASHGAIRSVSATAALCAFLLVLTRARADAADALRQTAEAAVLEAAHPRPAPWPAKVYQLCGSFEVELEQFRSNLGAHAPEERDASGYLRPRSLLPTPDLDAYSEFCAAVATPRLELSPAAMLTVAGGLDLRIPLGEALRRFRAATAQPERPPMPLSSYASLAAVGATALCALVASGFLIDAAARDVRRIEAAATGQIDRRTDEEIRAALSSQKTGAGITTALCAVGAAGTLGWALWKWKGRARGSEHPRVRQQLSASPQVQTGGAALRFDLSF